MNYIELINQFWQIRREKRFTAYEADLYYYLLNECNSRMWLNPFELQTNLLCAELGISRKTLSDLRNRLSQKGLIKFKEGNRNKSGAVYELIHVTLSNIQGNIQGNIDGNIQGNIQGNPIKNKQKQRLNNIPPNPQKGKRIKESVKFSFDFIEDEFKESFLTWLDYKKQRRETYKTQKSLELCYKQLKKMSNNSPYTATNVVERSMSNNWAGLFKLQENETNRRNNADAEADARRQYILEKAARAVTECDNGNG